MGKRDEKYLLLDGHLRLAALQDLGQTTVRCLIAEDDESFTYNKRVNRLATVQEHFMILRAVNSGVSEAKLAKALDVDIDQIRRRTNLLREICPEVVEMLKDQPGFEHEVIQDNDGKHVVNLYRPALLKAPAYIWKQCLDDYYKFDVTMAIIERNISQLVGDPRKLAKWEYMKHYVDSAKRRLFDFIADDLPDGY